MNTNQSIKKNLKSDAFGNVKRKSLQMKPQNKSSVKSTIRKCVALGSAVALISNSLDTYALSLDNRDITIGRNLFQGSRKIIQDNSCIYAGVSKDMYQSIPRTYLVQNIKAIKPKSLLVAQTKELQMKILKWDLGYATGTLNIRDYPSMDSGILSQLLFNEPVEYAKYNDEWYAIKFNDQTAYVYGQYISDSAVPYRSYYLSSSGFKSFMPYNAITSVTSTQYKIQRRYAYTGDYGIRQVNGRFCVAVGSAVDAPMGAYIDLVLQNGVIIPCVLSDMKADRDTRSDRFTTAANGCVSEFIVDLNCLKNDIKVAGTISKIKEEWESPVVEIRAYNKTIFDY